MAEKKAEPAPKLGKVDMSILTEDDIAALELQAEKEIKDEQRKAAKAKKLAEIKLNLSRKAGLEEAHEQVTVDLAPYCDRVLLDNRAFLQGQTYTLPVSQCQVIREAMQKTWAHQSQIDGKSENFYRKARASHVTESGGVVNLPNLLRA